MSESTTLSCGNENASAPVAMTTASADGDSSVIQQQSTTASVVVESSPRDIVARIYREELLKLADAARVNGNLAEYVMYERELERLNQTTSQSSGAISNADVAVPSPALSTGPLRAPSVSESSVVSIDYPEDLRTNHIKQEMTVQQFIATDSDGDVSRTSQVAFVEDVSGSRLQPDQENTCSRFPSLIASSSGQSLVPLTNLSTDWSLVPSRRTTSSVPSGLCE